MSARRDEIEDRDEVLWLNSRLEASAGAALSLLRHCIIQGEVPTRESLADEVGFTLGVSHEDALTELDEVAASLGVSSLQ